VAEATFAELVDHAAVDLNLTDQQLALAITKRLPEGKGYSSKQVSRIRLGELRRPSPEIVEAIIEVFDWDEDQEARAWLAAGLAPEGATLEDYREIVRRRRGTARDRRTDRTLEAVPTGTPAAVLRGPAAKSGDCAEARQVRLKAA
jgi:hypothetical protein